MLTFFRGLDPDLRDALLIQLRNLWTHSSTAIEGNTLTLGDTAFVLQEGLTIAGKSLKDHQEVVGHARAIDLLYELVRSEKSLAEDDLFALHKAVQTEVVFDVYKPVGQWKREPNSTAGIVDGRQVIFEYAPPEDVPELMKAWFRLHRNFEKSLEPGDRDKAGRAHAYLHVAFVRIHPFCDGNGRMARLVANLPVLKAGLPPIIIPGEKRKQYIDLLAAYHHLAGQIRAGDELVPHQDKLQPFIGFCMEAWQETLKLVDDAHARQRARTRERVIGKNSDD
ncbi:Fic family protein [Desulfomarina sp.]